MKAEDMKQNTSRASTNLLSTLVGAFSLILIVIAFCGVGGAGGCAPLVGAADAVDVRVEVTKPASSTNAPYLKLGNTYATFLTLYYLDENGKKVWSGFTTYVAGTFFVFCNCSLFCVLYMYE